MEEPSPVESLKDPLSEITRKERRNLLIASTLGVIVSKAGLVPTRIATLGIEFSTPAQNTFLVLIGLAVLYFIGAFILYGASDFLIWRKGYQDYLEDIELHLQSLTPADQAAREHFLGDVPDIGWLYQWSKPVVFLRIIFEFAVPVLFSVYAIISLVQKI